MTIALFCVGAIIGIPALGVAGAYVVSGLLVGDPPELNSVEHDELLGTWIGDGGARLSLYESGKFTATGLSTAEFEQCGKRPTPENWKLYEYSNGLSSSGKSMRRGTAVNLRFDYCIIDFISIKSHDVPTMCIVTDGWFCEGGVHFRKIDE